MQWKLVLPSTQPAQTSEAGMPMQLAHCNTNKQSPISLLESDTVLR